MTYAIKTDNLNISYVPFKKASDNIYQIVRDIDFMYPIITGKQYIISIIRFNSLAAFKNKEDYTRICDFTITIDNNISKRITYTVNNYTLSFRINKMKDKNDMDIYVLTLPEFLINLKHH